MPDRDELTGEREKRVAGIEGMEDDYVLFDIPGLRKSHEEKIFAIVRELRKEEYDGIIEGLETKFVKKYELERFR